MKKRTKADGAVDHSSIKNLTVPELVNLLAENGSENISTAAMKKYLAEGAPANPDGTIDLVAFTAWLLKKPTKSEAPLAPDRRE